MVRHWPSPQAHLAEMTLHHQLALLAAMMAFWQVLAVLLVQVGLVQLAELETLPLVNEVQDFLVAAISPGLG